MGPWLEDDDEAVFKRADGLVLRCEIPAQSRLAQDSYYTLVKLGYPFATLEKDPNKSSYKVILPQGTNALSIQAVPNKAWDLVNKATETLLVDPAQPNPSPLNDSEQAQLAAEMAERFLTEDAGEDGTNDIALFYRATDRSLTCATSYLEGWVDPVGGGYVPLQILAHPQAVSPDQPTIGPDGMPTPNMVLRYVTAPKGGQFTDSPAEAAPQWQPKIRGSVWGREHWRVFPESGTVNQAEKVIGLLYCTLGEAKRRWPDVASMDQEALDDLLNWTPIRFLVLLPPFQRARWAISGGADKEKAGASDERLLFYYRVLQKASPDHPKGAEVIVSGLNGGTILHKALLAMTVEIPTAHGTQAEVRCMDLPLVQVTPRDDPDERDPTGRCYMQLFCGATEFNSALATAYLEAVNQWVHPDSYIVSTSSVDGDQVQESRAFGNAIPILRPEDKPTYGSMPPIPANFWQGIEWNERNIDSIGSLNKPVTGADDQQEVSGKARQIAVQQAMVGLNRMQQPINAAHERWYRIKLQLAMRDFSTPQLIRYVGDDDQHIEKEWKANDFALVGSVGIQAGTGTMLPPEQKTQFIANLKAEGMIPPDEAADAARPTFAQRLGLQKDPHKTYIERCVTSWLGGPPQDQAGQTPWVEQWRTYQQQKQAYDQAQQQFAQQQQAFQQAQQNTAIVQAGPAPTTLGPESQNAQANTAYQQAVIALQMNPLGPPPVQPQTPPPVPPYTPFKPRPNDTEPPIAMLWFKRLSTVISTVKFDEAIPEWQQVLVEKYKLAELVIQHAMAPQAQPPKPKQDPNAQGPQGSQKSAGSQPTQPTQPTQTISG